MVHRCRRYDRQFKLESVRKVLVDGQKVKAVSLEWDIPEGVLYRWIGEFQKHPDDVFPGHGKRTTKDQEVYDLKRKLSQVEQERDILKKALVYFSNRSQ
jgi:transposase